MTSSPAALPPWLGESTTGDYETNPGEAAVAAVIRDLERRREALTTELTALDRRLRHLRTAPTLCPLCGGTGIHITHGGMYHELQREPCSCPAGAQP